jgi:hypothetical protein
MPETKSAIETTASLIQMCSVVAGVVISVLSFTISQFKESETRELEAAKPFLAVRQGLYAETLRTAGVLSNPEVHSKEELIKAKARFRELYVAELSMVESQKVEQHMVALARQIDPELLAMTPAQKATYDLSHALRDVFEESWRVKRN